MSYNTVILKGCPEIQEDVAAGAITPGHLIEFDTAGEVQVNSTAADPDAALMFAIEDSLQGNEITVAYAADDIVKHGTFKSGDEVYAIASEAIAVGDVVESAGNGKLQIKASGSGKAVGVCKVLASGDGQRVIIQVL